MNGTPEGIRIPAARMKTVCPRPLDDGGKNSIYKLKTLKLSAKKIIKQSREKTINIYQYQQKLKLFYVNTQFCQIAKLA